MNSSHSNLPNGARFATDVTVLWMNNLPSDRDYLLDVWVGASWGDGHTAKKIQDLLMFRMRSALKPLSSPSTNRV